MDTLDTLKKQAAAQPAVADLEKCVSVATAARTARLVERDLVKVANRILRDKATEVSNELTSVTNDLSEQLLKFYAAQGGKKPETGRLNDLESEQRLVTLALNRSVARLPITEVDYIRAYANLLICQADLEERIAMDEEIAAVTALASVRGAIGMGADVDIENSAFQIRRRKAAGLIEEAARMLKLAENIEKVSGGRHGF